MSWTCTSIVMVRLRHFMSIFLIIYLYFLLVEFLKIVHIDWTQKFGPIFRAWGGLRPIVAISSPEFMEVCRHKFACNWLRYFKSGFFFFNIAHPCEPKTDHQSNRVFLPQSVAGQLHVSNNRWDLTFPPGILEMEFGSSVIFSCQVQDGRTAAVCSHPRFTFKYSTVLLTSSMRKAWNALRNLNE